MNKKHFLLTLPFLALTLVLALVARRISDAQERIGVVPQAATPAGVATLSFSPSSTTVYSNQSLPINVMVSAPSSADPNGIIGIKMVANISPASSVQLSSDNVQTLLPSPWSYVFKNVSTANNVTTVSIEAVYLQAGPTGYTGAISTPQVFAVLGMESASPTSSETVTVQFDVSQSEIRGKTTNSDILSTNLTPGSYLVYVDTVEPNTQITGNPPTQTKNNSITFTFTGTDEQPPAPLTAGPLDFSYRLDTGQYSSFSTNASATFNNLSVGSHTFQVRARDAAGNVDSTPASHTFNYSPDTLISLQFKLKDKSSGGNFKAQNATLTIRNNNFNSGPLSVQAAYSPSTGNYTVPSFVVSNFPSTGNYDILLVVPGYLNKLLAGNSIQFGQTTNLVRTATADQMVWGDITLDNNIQMSDVTGAISEWSASSTPVTAQNQIIDQNEDGNITISDITAIISSWTASVVAGDN